MPIEFEKMKTEKSKIVAAESITKKNFEEKETEGEKIPNLDQVKKPEAKKRIKAEVGKSSIADRLSMIELNGQKWKQNLNKETNNKVLPYYLCLHFL